jgi:hypothetical protein
MKRIQFRLKGKTYKGALVKTNEGSTILLLHNSDSLYSEAGGAIGWTSNLFDGGQPGDYGFKYGWFVDPNLTEIGATIVKPEPSLVDKVRQWLGI